MGTEQPVQALMCLLEHDSDVASLMLQLAGKQAQCVHVLLRWFECATTEDMLSRDMALQLLASRQSGWHKDLRRDASQIAALIKVCR